MRSGGAINAEEATTFTNFIPRVTDTPQSSINKLAQLQLMFDNSLQIKAGTNRAELKKAGMWNIPTQPEDRQASNGKGPEADHDLPALEQEIQRRADARQKAQTSNKVPLAPRS